MSTKTQIKDYLGSQPDPQRGDLQALHNFILEWMPGSKLWFLDGRDEKGKVVSNPNIGYGSYRIQYADGTTKEFYQVGLSANSDGISVYIMGLKDKTFLLKTYGKKIGKATVTGYCIKFKTMKDIKLDVLTEAIRYRITVPN